jgi:hypothetical protein
MGMKTLTLIAALLLASCETPLRSAQACDHEIYDRGLMISR